jgi:signal transduction histidine kinase
VEAEVRQVAGGDPVAAIELATDRIMDVNRLAAATFSVATPGDYFGALVRMAGRLVDTRSTPRGVESLITTDAHTFSVVADGVSATALKAVEIGSEVSITGVLRPVSRTVDDPMSPAWVSPVDRLELLPRTASDIRVLAAPSWWTPRRLATLLAILAALATGAVIWAGLLRRQIAAQLRIIQSQVEARATHEERQRIAREFHDTLEQDLASIALQIDAAAHCTADEAQARQAFDQHRDMMARLRQETHDFLWDLRDKKRWDGSLGESLAAQAAYLQSLTDVRISCAIAAELPRVAADVQFHVLRIVREAVCNAIEHAKPSSIAIRAAVDGGECVITIADDGAGCDLAAAEAKTGHFGIVGMRERARRIGAALTVESGLGKGTAVTVRCQSRENTAI